MITHPRALKDTLYIIQKFKEETSLGISVLVSPTLIHDNRSLEAMKKAGADRVGIAMDAATYELFDRLRGKGVNGPHRWEHYWNVVRMAARVFGRFYVGIHLIVGLGETEKEMVEAIQKGQDWVPIPIYSLSSLGRGVPWKIIPRRLSASTEEFSSPAGSLMKPWDL